MRFTEARRATVVRSSGRGFEVDIAADDVALWLEGATTVKVDGQPRTLQRIDIPAGSYGVVQLSAGVHRLEP